jgi:N-acetylglutamate synthase
VHINADVVADTLADTWQLLTSASPDAWMARDGGAMALVSQVALPTLNGVWVVRSDADPAAVARLLGRVAVTGLPYCLQARPAAGPALAPLAAGRSMSAEEQIPLMVHEDPGGISGLRWPAGLTIRQLNPAEGQVHADVAAAGFEAPQQLFRELMTADVLDLPGLRCYVGEVGGQAVTTGVGITLGGGVGVFNIATPPPYRRRGYGAAITARAVADGLATGARWSWLQSSPLGYATYGRLGYRTIETWPCWVSAGSAHSSPPGSTSR